MSRILITGASGFLGTALIPKLLGKGSKIYALSRHPPEARENLIPLFGDVTEPDLGLKEVPGGIESLFHLAAIHRLGESRAEEIWETNVGGTMNVIECCKKHEIPHLLFVSTAYVQGRNAYERSKAYCDWMVLNSGVSKVTIFKPSIIMGTPQHFYPGHVSQFISLLIKIHERAEVVRRKIEGSLRLPVLEPVFRLRANPSGKLNLVSIEDVTRAMVDIGRPGIFWLTHPAPPTIWQLVEWIGEFIMVKIKLEPLFRPTPIEVAFQKMAKAFEPYLWGDRFPSNLREHAPITREFIHSTIKQTLLG